MKVHMVRITYADGSEGYGQTGFKFSSATCKGWSAGGFKLALRNAANRHAKYTRDPDRYSKSLDEKFENWLKQYTKDGHRMEVIEVDLETLKANCYDIEVWYNAEMRGK